MLSKRIETSSASRLIMGGTSFSFPSAPSVQGDVLAYHVASAALLPTSRAWAIGSTPTDGIALVNTTAAAAGAQQFSPSVHFGGQGWKSDAVAASQACDMRVYLQAVQGTSVASSQLCIDSSINAGAYANKLTLTSGGVLTTPQLAASEAASSFRFGSSVVVDGNYDRSSGLGAGSNFFKYANAGTLQFINGFQTDTASKVVNANVYDHGGAAIANAATMRDLMVSWTDTSNVNRQMIAGYYSGALWLAAGGGAALGVHSGAGITFDNFNELLTIAAAATSTTTAQIPASAIVLAVSYRVTTVIPTAATFTIGVAGATTRYGTGISTAAGTAGISAVAPTAHAAAEGIVVTPNASPADNTGRLRIACTWYLPTAPTA